MGRAGRQFRGFARVNSQIPMKELWISSETGQNLGQWSGYRSDLGVGSLLLAGEFLWLMFPWKRTQCCGDVTGGTSVIFLKRKFYMEISQLVLFPFDFLKLIFTEP